MLKVDVILNPSNYTLSESDIDFAVSFESFIYGSDGRNYFMPFFGYHINTFENG